MKSILTLLAIGARFASASSESYQRLVTIPWAPSNSTSVDQSVIYNGTYYLSDRANKGVQVVDFSTTRQATLIEGFQGLVTVDGKPDYTKSGPDGILILPDRKELYVGDGNGSVKVVDLATNSIVANITVNSTKRADKMAYDVESGTVVCTLPNENSPQVAVISAKSRTVKGYITFDEASSLEQPAWNSVNKQFYISIPSTKTNPGGAVAVIDVNGFNISKMLPLPQCIPAGIVFGPQQNLFVGCSQNQIMAHNMSYSLVMNVTTGDIVANISGVSGVDQVTYDSHAGCYYASAYRNLAGGISTGAPLPQLAVINASTNQLFQAIKTDNVTACSVAVDPITKDFVVPVYQTGFVVYSLTNTTSGNSTNGNSTTSASSTSGVNETVVIHSFCYILLVLFAGISNI